MYTYIQTYTYWQRRIMTSKRDQERLRRELEEERQAIEEDRHRYDDIYPELNAMSARAFPDGGFPQDIELLEIKLV